MSEEVSRADNGGRFINLWDLVAQIGKAEAIYAYEAARDLASCLSDDPIGLNYIRRRDELGILCPMDLDARLRLLRLLSIFGSHATLFDDDDRPNDEAQPTFERFGFYASDIYPFLARHDVAISRPGDEDSKGRVFADGRRIPGWILTYDGQTWIPYGRVVGILTASTVAAERHSPEHDDVVGRWSTALSDAIERGAIGTTTVSGKQMLAHADVLMWCAQHGYVWPLEAQECGPEDKSNAVLSTGQQVPSSPSTDASKLAKRERQIRVVEEMADKLGYSRLQIPDGGQTEIHKLCHAKDPHLFTENHETFRGIWKDAVKANRVRMANHNKFAGG
ncbi:hypothetical protein [Burkholderia vietnamiensis]|uniref:hypothetical protein n=1 Tax=Burkholderia vietnamiensis TaxID=60552 RepID=UPI00158BC735|nr:hypothetical protein [Burkholderia vietnamiensis]